jgi:hypothetical protein
MGRSPLLEFRLELSGLVLALSILGLLLVIPAFFFPTWQPPLIGQWTQPTQAYHVWIFLGAAIGLLGGAYYFFSTFTRLWRFLKLLRESDSRAALKRNIKELEELAPYLPSWCHDRLDKKRDEYRVR